MMGAVLGFIIGVSLLFFFLYLSSAMTTSKSVKERAFYLVASVVTFAIIIFCMIMWRNLVW